MKSIMKEKQTFTPYPSSFGSLPSFSPGGSGGAPFLADVVTTCPLLCGGTGEAGEAGGPVAVGGAVSPGRPLNSTSVLAGTSNLYHRFIGGRGGLSPAAHHLITPGRSFCPHTRSQRRRRRLLAVTTQA